MKASDNCIGNPLHDDGRDDKSVKSATSNAFSSFSKFSISPSITNSTKNALVSESPKNITSEGRVTPESNPPNVINNLIGPFWQIFFIYIFNEAKSYMFWMLLVLSVLNNIPAIQICSLIRFLHSVRVLPRRGYRLQVLQSPVE